jgi:hypothetical protein
MSSHRCLCCSIFSVVFCRSLFVLFLCVFFDCRLLITPFKFVLPYVLQVRFLLEFVLLILSVVCLVSRVQSCLYLWFVHSWLPFPFSLTLTLKQYPKWLMLENSKKLLECLCSICRNHNSILSSFMTYH